MKNKRLKKVFMLFCICILTLFLFNMICNLKLMGKYFESSIGKTTTFEFQFNKIKNSNNKRIDNYHVMFNKIIVENITYKYKLKNNSLCFYENNELLKCLYNSKKEAYENDSDYYKSTTYLKTKANKDGYYIKDNKLIAYFGKDSEIILPSSIKEIEKGAFSKDFERGVNLEKITIPSNIETIKSGAFSMTNATVIIIDEGVSKIERLSFSDSNISEIYLPSSIVELGFGILDSESQVLPLKIYCVKDSYACNEIRENPPKTKYEIIYR